MERGTSGCGRDLPIETPALTVNRLCGSGMQAIVSAAQMIQTDEAKVVLAGGMESMSQAPFSIRGRDGFTLAPGGKLEDSLMVALLDSYCGLYMANTAELYGEQQGITRQAQDEFALRSQQKADAAYKAGRIAGRADAGAAAEFEGRGDGRDADRGRSPASADDDGGPGEAAGCVWQEWDGDGGECQRHCGWRGGGGGDVAGAGAEAQSQVRWDGL